MSRTRRAYSTCTACANRVKPIEATLYLIRRPGHDDPEFGGYLCPECVSTMNRFALGLQRLAVKRGLDINGVVQAPLLSNGTLGADGRGRAGRIQHSEAKPTPSLTTALEVGS